MFQSSALVRCRDFCPRRGPPRCRGSWAWCCRRSSPGRAIPPVGSVRHQRLPPT